MPEIVLPTFHAKQAEIYRARTKRNAVRCGRRFGKTKMMVTMACALAIKGKKVGVFAPEHKQLQEPYDEILTTLSPIVSASNKTDGVIKCATGGKIDFWRLIDNELAGRGREYDLVLVDEAAFTKSPQMFEIWRKSITPTMATRPWAETWIFSTPNGNNPENFFYKVCKDADLGFKEFWAESASNPDVSREWLEEERRKNHPDVFRQEYLAEFVDWSGASFLEEAKLLVDGEPPPWPDKCHIVFAVIDTAVKTGAQHDGTGVVYFAQYNFPEPHLYILDWDLVQIEGALLETWLPTVFQNCEAYAKQCGAFMGSMGAYIEDKATGMVLLQRAFNLGWPVEAVPSKITSVGKEERAISVSGHVYQGLVKMTHPAYEKTTDYKGATRNHLLGQVLEFRLGQKRDNAQDDLLDCFTSGIAIALNDSEGF